jgi:hypothetical protein
MLPTKQFQSAGLKLAAAKAPFGQARNAHVFGLDIEGDSFRMWKPEHVTAQVQAQDAKMRQVILTVKEPEATFRVEIPKHLVIRGDREIRQFRRGRLPMVEVERKTSRGTRHFLCGVDERDHPFIAQLPQAATSIKVAHELLKPPELRGQPIRGHGKNSRVKSRKAKTATRQGEWFLIALGEGELKQVEEAVAKAGVLKNRRLGFEPRGMERGKPHTADEVIMFTKDGDMRPTLYMRGKLRHVEHATLDFPDWVRVVRNTEAGGATAGATWVD